RGLYTEFCKIMHFFYPSLGEGQHQKIPSDSSSPCRKIPQNKKSAKLENFFSQNFQKVFEKIEKNHLGPPLCFFQKFSKKTKGGTKVNFFSNPVPKIPGIDP